MIQDNQNSKFTDEPLAIAVGGTIDDFDESIIHKKESCCFCCCDYRRAVIIINGLLVLSALLGLLQIDEMAKNMVTMGFPDYQFINAIVVFIDLVQLALYGGGLFGAVFYVRNGVIAGIAGHCLKLLSIGYGVIWILANGDEMLYEALKESGTVFPDEATAEAAVSAAKGMAVFSQLMAMILTIICIHAHGKLLNLMKQGVMTQQNYPNVASCCC